LILLHYEQIETDVLIIGGGSAGVLAAIKAKELDPKARVAVFEKGDIKYSGSIPMGMDALNIVAIPGVNTAHDYVEATKIFCQNVVDETTSYVMADRSWELLKKLEGWGVCFPRDKDGELEALKVHPKGRFAVTMKEPKLKVILAERLARTDCMVFNRTMAIELLVDDGRVAGAIGLNVRTGEILVCKARSVILSAGGAARFGLPENGYLYGIFDCPANAGDAYVLGYNAGAKLTGLEYTMASYIIRDINAPLLYITLTRGAHLFNAMGSRLDQDSPSTRSMMIEHRNDRSPLFMRLSHLTEQQISSVEEILFTTERPVLERFFQGRGINFRNSDIELGPTEFFLCGGHGITGIAVNEAAESTLAGLYAAGDTANVARGHLTGAFVFGEIAAESALKNKNSYQGCDVPKNMEAVWDKINGWQNSKGLIGVDEVEYKVRRIINGYAIPPKNEIKLNRAIESLTSLRKDLNETVAVKNVNDLVKAFEVDNIITCGILSAKASLHRKESRWGFWHYRSDYPEKNDSWEKHVAVYRGSCNDDVLVDTMPLTKLEGGLK
jgi:succinate dehydrogenase/fumarate reductase flavoprotein subunit